MPDFDQLRRQAADAWLELNRDNREPLRDFLVSLADAIEAVSVPKAELRTGVSGQGQDVTVSTERREPECICWRRYGPSQTNRHDADCPMKAFDPAERRERDG